MAVAQGERAWVLNEDAAVSEKAQLLLVDDRYQRTVTLEIGGRMCFNGWKTKEFTV